jgi:putative PIN family toxin of toxin-antitoxin system
MFRAVLDTNVVVSSVISKKGAPFHLLQAWTDLRFTFITSESIIEEVQRVLSKPDVKDVFRLTDERISQLAETMRQNAVVVPGKADVRGAIPEDPSDEMFLAAALDGKAGFIISGDKHLLDLKTFRGIEIQTARKFLDTLNADE